MRDLIGCINEASAILWDLKNEFTFSKVGSFFPIIENFLFYRWSFDEKNSKVILFVDERRFKTIEVIDFAESIDVTIFLVRHKNANAKTYCAVSNNRRTNEKACSLDTED